MKDKNQIALEVTKAINIAKSVIAQCQEELIDLNTKYNEDVARNKEVIAMQEQDIKTLERKLKKIVGL